MTARKITPDSHEHWLELRMKDITSTESAALFGMSPYTTELELYHRKSTGTMVEFKDNFRMKAGRVLESGIAELAGDELGCEIEPFKDYVTDEESRMGSSFDYKITSGEYKTWILEIKNVDYLQYRDKWEDNEAPDHIEVQVQHQLELTNRPGAVIACLVGGNELKLIMRPRNRKMGLGIKQRIATFWADVDAGNEPQADYNRDAEFLLAISQSANGMTHDAVEDTEINRLIDEYIMAEAAEKDAKQAKKSSKAAILNSVGEASYVLADGYKISCGMTKDTDGKLVTTDMVGTKIGARKGYRNFRINEIKEKK